MSVKFVKAQLVIRTEVTSLKIVLRGAFDVLSMSSTGLQFEVGVRR